MGKKRRTLAILLTAAMVVTMQSFPAYAQGEELTEQQEEASETSTIRNIMNTGNRDNAYSAYYEKHRDDSFPKSQIVIEAKDAVPSADADGEEPQYEILKYEGQEDCLKWTNNRGELNYEFEVAEAGNYSLEFFYYTLSGGSTTIKPARTTSPVSASSRASKRRL